MMNDEPDEEEMAELRQQYDRDQMRAQDLFNRMRRMITEELSPDQLEVLHNMFIAVTRAQSPSHLAEWYEGMLQGVRFTRDIRLGEVTTEQDEQQHPS